MSWYEVGRDVKKECYLYWWPKPYGSTCTGVDGPTQDSQFWLWQLLRRLQRSRLWRMKRSSMGNSHCALLEDSLRRMHEKLINIHWLSGSNTVKYFERPFRLRCIARSTTTDTGKDPSRSVSVWWRVVTSGKVLQDLLRDLLGKETWSASSDSSSKSSSWWSESLCSAKFFTEPVTSVMWTLREAPCKSAAERLNNGNTPATPKIWS